MKCPVFRVCLISFVALSWLNYAQGSTKPATTRPAQEETFGASEGNELGPLAGGKGYKRLVTKYDYLVKSPRELVDALAKAKAGQVVYVADDAEIDLSVRVCVDKLVLKIPGGVTLASGRGKNGSEGGLICCNEFDVRGGLMVTAGDNVRITGLRIRGPDPKDRIQEYGYLGRSRYYRFPFSRGICTTHANLEVDNCEICLCA